MTTFLWILLGGFALGIIGTIIFALTKKQTGLIISMALAVACLILFGVDISLNPIKNPELVSQSAQELNFAEMVSEYRTNEIRAKEIYENNRYKISAEIINIERAGVREGFSGYNVEMVIDVDNKDFSLCANFQGDLKDEVMKLNTGDILTFTGNCVAPELWYDCTIVEVE